MKKKQPEMYYRTVELPFLRATVHFLDMSKLQGIDIKGSGYTTVMNENPENGGISIAIFYEKIEETVRGIHHMPMVFHEITHAMQFICRSRNINMTEETEMVAYLLGYLAEELLCPTQ